MPHPVIHWEIWAEDDNKIGQFYQQLFGWNVNFVPGLNYHLVQTGGEGGINGGILKPKPGPIPQNRVTFYIQVEDLQATLDKAVSLGGSIVVGPTPIPGVGAMALFKDPEGNVIGLFKP